MTVLKGKVGGQWITLSGAGPQGPPGPAGGGAMGEWVWSTATAAPTAGAQVRVDVAHPYTTITRVWLRPTTNGGVDATTGLMLIQPGQTLYIQDKNDATLYVRVKVTAAPTNQTTYIEVPVAWVANGAALLNNQAAMVHIGAAANGVPPGGATNALLAKSSASDYAMAWTTTPILTTLTVQQTTAPWFLLSKTGAPAQAWYQRFHSNGSWMMGPTNDDNYALAGNAGRQIVCGGDVTVSGNLTTTGNLSVNNPGGITAKNSPKAIAIIDPASGAVTIGYNAFSGTKLGVGKFRFSMSGVTGQIIPIATAWGNASTFASAFSQAANTVDVSVYDAAGAAIDVYCQCVVYAL